MHQRYCRHFRNGFPFHVHPPFILFSQRRTSLALFNDEDLVCLSSLDVPRAILESFWKGKMLRISTCNPVSLSEPRWGKIIQPPAATCCIIHSSSLGGSLFHRKSLSLFWSVLVLSVLIALRRNHLFSSHCTTRSSFCLSLSVLWQQLHNMRACSGRGPLSFVVALMSLLFLVLAIPQELNLLLFRPL